MYYNYTNTLPAITATLVYDGCEDGELRLEGSSNSQEGRVEICINNAWGTICDNDWNVRDGNVVCAQLGFQPFGKGFLIKFCNFVHYSYFISVRFYSTI